MMPFLIMVSTCLVVANGLESFTHVSQAPFSGPNARFQAGSRDWKNSSGWKNVVRVRALMRRRR